MDDKNPQKKQRDEAIIVQETREKTSIHFGVEKFHTGQLIYNRITKEDGFIIRIFVGKGVVTYEVWVPKESNSWESGHWISRWPERVLESSGNKRLGSPLTN
jgi:hypothetical protein